MTGDAPLKIDIHTHILPETWPDLRERYGYGGWVSLEPCGSCRAKMMMTEFVPRSINCPRRWTTAR